MLFQLKNALTIESVVVGLDVDLIWCGLEIQMQHHVEIRFGGL